MSNLIMRKLEKLNPWHFVWIAIICSESLTLLISLLISLALWDGMSNQVLVVGIIDSFIVSLTVVGFIIYLIKRSARLDELNKFLQTQIKIREDVEVVLRTSEAKFRQLHESMMDAFVYVDMSGRIIECNAVLLNMLGYTEQEAHNLTYIDITPESWREAESLIIERQVLSRGYSDVYEKEYVRKDGTLIPIELRTVLFKDENGHASGLWATIRDITERKRAEEDIRKSKQQYDKLVSQITIGTYVLHSTPAETFTLDYVSPKMAEMLNLSVESLLADAQIVFQAIHPDDRDSFVKLYQDGFRQRRPFDWEGRVQVEGNVKWLHINSLPEPMETGDVLWYGIVDDVSERKQADLVLRESESEIRALYSAMTEGLATHNIVYSDGEAIDYIITDLNPTYEKITGMTRAAVLGRKASEIYGSENPPYLDIYARVASGGTPENFETYFPPMKKYFSISVFSPRKGRFATLFADISDRKLAEIYGDMGREVLQILNEPGDMQDSLQRILSTLKMRTEFDAVGIRLQDKDDFPYVYQEGFPKDFLLTENTLVERSVDGGVCRDKDGCVKLECTCGLVICDKTDPASPFFTPGGSFWTNDSSPLLDIPPSEDPRLHPRNECIIKVMPPWL